MSKSHMVGIGKDATNTTSHLSPVIKLIIAHALQAGHCTSALAAVFGTSWQIFAY